MLQRAQLLPPRDLNGPEIETTNGAFGFQARVRKPPFNTVSWQIELPPRPVNGVWTAAWPIPTVQVRRRESKNFGVGLGSQLGGGIGGSQYFNRGLERKSHVKPIPQFNPCRSARLFITKRTSQPGEFEDAAHGRPRRRRCQSSLSPGRETNPQQVDDSADRSRTISKLNPGGLN
jgi:hypothetical protein